MTRARTPGSPGRAPSRGPGAPSIGRGSRYGFLTVGQTARVVGVSPSTLRLWENVGLVSPTRTEGRYRLYGPELVKVLKRIKYLRDVKQINVPGIKQALGGTARGAKPPAGRAAALGPKLRRLRTKSGMSIAEAAKRARISPGFLSVVERGRSQASVATLQRLAAAYGTTVVKLFQYPKRSDRVVRPDARRVLDTTLGVKMELLSVGTTMLECMLFRVAPGAGSDGSYAHQGEEFLYMLEGTLEFWLDDVECHVLGAGDGFWFESTLAHRWFNPGQTEAVLLWVNTPPTF